MIGELIGRGRTADVYAWGKTEVMPDVVQSVAREEQLYFHDAYLAEYKRLCAVSEEVLRRWRTPTLAARLVEVDGFDLEEIIQLLMADLQEE